MFRHHQHSILLLALLALQVTGAGHLAAQTNVEVNAGLQLNLSQPGARSLGMGSAFIGLADDATAAYTNPAGLANLSTLEIALEGRAWDFSTTFTDDGVGVFTGSGLDESALIEGEAESSADGYSFGSFVYPSKGRWVWAIYRHQLSDFETGFETRGAELVTGSGDFEFFPVRASTQLEIAGSGLAAAVRINDALSLGFGVIRYEMTWESSTRRFISEFGRDIDFWVNQQDIEADDEALAASVGFEWKLSERWRLGGVYRRGAEFDFQTRNTGGPASDRDGELGDVDARVFRVPDVYGLGVAYKTASFRILFDWVRVEYSMQSEGVENALSDGDNLDIAARRLTIDDADELHLGFEYVFASLANPIAVRLGAWLDPDHQVRYEGPIDSQEAAATALLFRGGDDEIHYTGGLGVAFSDGRFELHAAVDLSERIDTAALSLIMRLF